MRRFVRLKGGSCARAGFHTLKSGIGEQSYIYFWDAV